MSAALRAAYSTGSDAVSHRLLHEPLMFTVAWVVPHRPAPVLDALRRAAHAETARRRLDLERELVLAEGEGCAEEGLPLVVEALEAVEAAVRRGGSPSSRCRPA
jgi:hypothetical protein